MRYFSLLIFAFVGVTAYAQGRSATEQRLSVLEDQIDDVRQQVELARTEEQNAIRALNRLDTELTLRETLVAEYREEADGLRAETRELEGSIDRLETEVEEARAAYRERAVHAYKRGRTSLLAIVFSSASIGQMIVRARYLRQFANDRRRHIDQVKETTAALRKKNDELEESLATTREMINESQTEYQQLSQRKSERSALVTVVQARRGELEAELEQRRKDAAQLQALVRELIAAERRRQEEEARRIAEERRRAEEAARREEARRVAEARRRPVNPTEPPTSEPERGREDIAANTPDPAPIRAEDSGSPRPEPERNVDNTRSNADPTPTEAPEERPAEPDEASRERERASATSRETTVPEIANRLEALSGSFRSNRGNLPWPADGTVTGRYGARTDPDLGTTVRSVGIDIATGPGAPVRAVFQGVVERIAEMPTYGTYVIVTHGSYSTVYGNLSRVSVRRGQTVQAGEGIGSAGTAKSRRGSALFFAVFDDGQAVSPTSWLR